VVIQDKKPKQLNNFALKFWCAINGINGFLNLGHKLFLFLLMIIENWCIGILFLNL
jgi:hypothetical protein